MKLKISRKNATVMISGINEKKEHLKRCETKSSIYKIF
jgi:hypothetical protein